ncbi:phosphatase PAP2 family protein [Hyalangium sp.]|uniref:phosphatase PAP2 family protein n=1 Tax=Hyalangium sp. TaxID=2028555 RepID=UPI002D2AF191|nr:phosphatase PAP2 family protein [Hyalangium sp.]HYH98730.1 phosphatase PAP2 family protein [Hyalangium sp.]
MTSLSPDKTGSKGFSWLITLAGVSHLLFVTVMGKLRWEHAAADLLLVGLAWAGPAPRRFLRGGFPIWLCGMLLDNQWLWLGLRGQIHTGDLWELERMLFPAPGGTTWPAWFETRTHAVLDFFCGFSYAAYLYEVFALALLFFFRKSPRFEIMCWAFLLMNAMGVVTYVVYPAAPPWYVMQYGPGPADLTAAPSPAGTSRFDALLGIRYFANFYARNPNVFGAMPSLHVAYPVLVTWQAWRMGWAWRVGTAGFAALVAFSAIYLQHHYILDVVAGLVAALVACAVVEYAVARRESLAAAPVPLMPEGDSRA